MRIRIEPRKTFWKQRHYKNEAVGSGIIIQRLVDEEHPIVDLDQAIRKLLRRKQKWE